MDDSGTIQEIYQSFEMDETIGESQLFANGLVIERLIKAENSVTKHRRILATQVEYIEELLKRIEILEIQNETSA